MSWQNAKQSNSTMNKAIRSLLIIIIISNVSADLRDILDKMLHCLQMVSKPGYSKFISFKLLISSRVKYKVSVDLVTSSQPLTEQRGSALNFKLDGIKIQTEATPQSLTFQMPKSC